MLNVLNFTITNSTFDDGMKFADVTPIFKRDELIHKEYYLQKEIATYIETYLWPFL